MYESAGVLFPSYQLVRYRCRIRAQKRRKKGNDDLHRSAARAE